MSFKLFVYYCAVCGAWFGFFGWLLGRQITTGQVQEMLLLKTILRGLALGMMVALGLGVVDALWNQSTRKIGPVIVRGLFVAVIGCLSGLVGSAVGEAFHWGTGLRVLVPFGWLLTGLLIGASVGTYDLFLRLRRAENPAGAMAKIFKGLLGGALGGLLGGLLYLLLGQMLSGVLGQLLHQAVSDPASPSAWGFVALGGCIGLFIGLAQVILKEAWVRVETGFRPGRELILSKEETTIGRAETCDIGLFGDPGIEKIHARILLRDKRYLLDDSGTPGGTFVNDEKITQPTPLRSGDAIRVGKSILRFSERQKKEMVR